MKKIARNILLVLALAGPLAACEDAMRDINTNPEMQEETKPEYLFASATQNFLNSARPHLMGKYAGVMSYMQYVVPATGGNNPQGSFSNPANETGGGAPGLQYYDDYYTWRGRDLRRVVSEIDRIKDPARKATYQDLKAVALILETYHAWLVGDVYGSMPYRDAFQALSGNITPGYDNLRTLYKEWDRMLKEQVAAIEASEDAKQARLSGSDFFYEGNALRWAKFANTLRVKIAQRFEQVDAAHYASVLSDVEKSPSGVMIALADGCLYMHPSDHNNNIDDINQILTSYAAGHAFVEFLGAHEDPRLPLMVRKNWMGDESPAYRAIAASAHADSLVKHPLYGRRYVGMYAAPEAYLAGGVNSVTSTFKGKDVALMNGNNFGSVSFRSGAQPTDRSSLQMFSALQGRLFVKNGGMRNVNDPLRLLNEEIKDFNGIYMETPVLSFPEACFMFAEVAEKRGGAFAGKDAATWYNEGVRSSMQWYQKRAAQTYIPGTYGTDQSLAITEDRIGRYLSEKAPYTGSKQERLAKIYSQAWVHLLTQPEEAWAMWKRTGYPQWYQGGDDVKPASGIAYLEKLRAGSVIYTLPRRMDLPMSNTNAANWQKGLDELLKDAAYGRQGKTHGRIFWDVNPHQ